MGLSIRIRGGTPLRDEEFREIIKEIDSPRARYNMAAGEAYSRFFESLRRGEILGTYCPGCGLVHIPPKIYCPYCFRYLTKWVRASDEGRVVTAVVSYLSATLERLEKPEIIGIIRLDVPGYRFTSYRFPGILHRICGASEDDVKSQRIFDARVKARWAPEDRRIGSINDIECFEVMWR